MTISDILRDPNLWFAFSAHSHLVYLIFLNCGFICIFLGNSEYLSWGCCPPEGIFAFVWGQGTPLTWDHFSLCWRSWANDEAIAPVLNLSQSWSPDSRICSHSFVFLQLPSHPDGKNSGFFFYFLLMVLVGLEQFLVPTCLAMLKFFFFHFIEV